MNPIRIFQNGSNSTSSHMLHNLNTSGVNSPFTPNINIISPNVSIIDTSVTQYNCNMVSRGGVSVGEGKKSCQVSCFFRDSSGEMPPAPGAENNDLSRKITIFTTMFNFSFITMCPCQIMFVHRPQHIGQLIVVPVFTRWPNTCKQIYQWF